MSHVVAEELFGPSVGKELRNNAFLAVLIAGICMLVYIRFRFRQWRFGGAALLGVLHDVLIVIAFYAIFNITINNPFIAGILTVVGYSINDTIVVFDRIRENLRLKRRHAAGSAHRSEYHSDPGTFPDDVSNDSDRYGADADHVRTCDP